MTQKERSKHEQQLFVLIQALHMSVIYEDNFLRNLNNSQIALLAYRDDLLDKINFKRRLLGLLI